MAVDGQRLQPFGLLGLLQCLVQRPGFIGRVTHIHLLMVDEFGVGVVYLVFLAGHTDGFLHIAGGSVEVLTDDLGFGTVGIAVR